MIQNVLILFNSPTMEVQPTNQPTENKMFTCVRCSETKHTIEYLGCNYDNWLVAFHEEKNIEMPPRFTDLFAKHLDAGNPLEPPPPLVPGNLDEELG